jgi:hypothetical protein
MREVPCVITSVKIVGETVVLTQTLSAHSKEEQESIVQELLETTMTDVMRQNLHIASWEVGQDGFVVKITAE